MHLDDRFVRRGRQVSKCMGWYMTKAQLVACRSAVYCAASALCKKVICVDGTLADFLRRVFALLSTMRPMRKKRVVDIDGTLANFSMQFSWLAVYCAAGSPAERVICTGGALANFSCHDVHYCNGSSLFFYIQLHYVGKNIRKWFQKKCVLLSGGTFERDHFKCHFWMPF